MINLEFDSIVFQEGNTYVAYSPKLDVSSCGGTVNEALNNLKTAVRLFLEEAEKMGTLEDILSELVCLCEKCYDEVTSYIESLGGKVTIRSY